MCGRRNVSSVPRRGQTSGWGEVHSAPSIFQLPLHCLTPSAAPSFQLRAAKESPSRGSEGEKYKEGALAPGSLWLRLAAFSTAVAGPLELSLLTGSASRLQLTALQPAGSGALTERRPCYAMPVVSPTSAILPLLSLPQILRIRACQPFPPGIFAVTSSPICSPSVLNTRHTPRHSSMRPGCTAHANKTKVPTHCPLTFPPHSQLDGVRCPCV